MQHPMITLWSVADQRKLTDEVLNELRRQDNVTMQLDCLSEVIDGIGCLVASDKDAGNFTSTEDLPTLMFSLSTTIKDISAMAWVGNEARSLLSARIEAREVKS